MTGILDIDSQRDNHKNLQPQKHPLPNIQLLSLSDLGIGGRAGHAGDFDAEDNEPKGGLNDLEDEVGGFFEAGEDEEEDFREGGDEAGGGEGED